MGGGGGCESAEAHPLLRPPRPQQETRRQRSPRFGARPWRFVVETASPLHHHEEINDSTRHKAFEKDGHFLFILQFLFLFQQYLEVKTDASVRH